MTRPRSFSKSVAETTELSSFTSLMEGEAGERSKGVDQDTGILRAPEFCGPIRVKKPPVKREAKGSHLTTEGKSLERQGGESGL